MPKQTQKPHSQNNQEDDGLDANLAQMSMLKGHEDLTALNDSIAANREEIKSINDLVIDLSEQVAQANTKTDPLVDQMGDRILDFFKLHFPQPISGTGDTLPSGSQREAKPNLLQVDDRAAQSTEASKTVIVHDRIDTRDLPKFSEDISSDEAFRFLGKRSSHLDDDELLIARSLKFLSFRSSFERMTEAASDVARKEALYRCLLGSARDRAVRMEVSSFAKLMDGLANIYASAANPAYLEDALRDRLENSSMGPNETLSDYILRYDLYRANAASLLTDFSISEAACCRFFLKTLRSNRKLYQEMIR